MDVHQEPPKFKRVQIRYMSHCFLDLVTVNVYMGVLVLEMCSSAGDTCLFQLAFLSIARKDFNFEENSENCKWLQIS